MPFTPDEMAAMRAHYSDGGPVHAAFGYLTELVDATRRPLVEVPTTYAGLWARTDPELRFVRAQAWLWRNRAAAAVGLATAEDAMALAEETSSHPLWQSFAYTELAQLLGVWGGTELAFVGAASRQRVLGADLEIVILADTRRLPHIISEPTLIRTIAAWAMRYRDGRWRIASHTDRLPEPGWPPTFS